MTNLGAESGSAPFNSALWTMLKFYYSLKGVGEQIKIMGIFFGLFFSSDTKGTKRSEVIFLHLLCVIGTHSLNIMNGNKFSPSLFQ